MASLLEEQERRREEVARHRENRARLAQSFAVFVTNGQGTNQYEERLPFALTFIEKPVVSYGSACDIEDLADLLGTDPDLTPLPLSSGHVVEWDQDERGFYTGCWVAVRVSFPSIDMVDPTALTSVEHHFTFSAIAMKDIPVDAEATPN